MSAVESNFEGVVSTLVPLAGMSSQQQAQVIEHSEVLHFEKGDFVFNEGDTDPYSFYLLDGQIELLSSGQTIQRVTGGSDAATHPMAQLQPRKMSARAETPVAVLQVERALLEELRAFGDADGAAAFQVAEIDSEEDDDWMTRMLQSKLFSNLPASNIHRIFSKLETVETAEGDIVVRQGDPGDFYYVLVKGRAEITRAASPNAPGFRLALIGPGDAFGEEALVGGGPRNATVKMISAGELVRLTAEDFDELIKNPLLSTVSLDEARDIETARGGVWLDVRFPEQHERDALPNSINHPLNTLRMHSGRLDESKTYLIYCDDGGASSIAAFLLAERGFDVHFLSGGLNAYRETRDDEPDAAVEPASRQTPANTPAEDPSTAAAVLDAEVEINELRIADNAKRERELAAAQARKAAELEAQKRLAAEREKSEAESKRREAAIAEARESAAREAEQQLAEEREKTQAELAQARAEAERIAEQKTAAEAEREKSHAELAELRKQQALETQQRQEAEQRAEALLKAREAAANEAAKRLEEERKVSQAEFTQTLRKAEMEAQMRLEAERKEAEKKIAEERAKVAAELERLREQAAEQAASLVQAEREKSSAELERARKEAERLAEEKLRAEREKLAKASEQTKQELEQARRHKEELEQARAEAEARAEQERNAQAERVDQVRAEMERRIKEEERKLRESYAWQAEELQRLKEQKAAAEERLKEEQARVTEQSEKARSQLLQAREYQNRLEQVQQASAAEAAMREQQEIELKRRLREELNRKVQTERVQLEQELARNATELQRARREREAAEAARVAAAEEAKKVVAEFKAAHARKRAREEAEMRVERERLETETKRLRLAFELAQRERDAALQKQQEIEAEIAARSSASTEMSTREADLLRDLEAAADDAAEQVRVAERARADMQAAAVASAGDLAAHKVQEVHAREDLKQELDAWLSEQDEVENSDAQRALLANQKEHMERIKKRAAEARKAAKDHDQSLIDELAQHLQGSD